MGPSKGGNSIFSASLKLLLNRTLMMTQFLCCKLILNRNTKRKVQGGSNMTRTDLYVNKPHCAAAVRP